MTPFDRMTRLLACAAFALAGCSSGTATGQLPTAQQPAASPAAFVITIPAKASSAQYVSPSTQSIAISVAPQAGCTACTPVANVDANLTPTSPNCAAVGGATKCTVPISLNPGAYYANVDTYDGTLSGGAPTGNRLSSAQTFPFAILSNASNNVLVTLNGVPASVSATLTGTPAATLSGSNLTIDGASASTTLAVTAKDAAGNVIVGVGAPVISAAVSGNPSFNTSVSGSNVTITTPAAGSRTAATVTISLQAPGCPGGAGCSTSLNVGMTEFLAVTDFGTGMASIYSERTHQWQPIIAGAGTSPVAFDRAGDLFVGNDGANNVQEFAPPYTGPAIATITNGITGPSSLAVDSQNNLYVGNYGAATVTKYAPPYTGAPALTIGAPAASSPYSLLIDGSDDLWIANDGANKAAYYFPAPVSASNSTALVAAAACEGIAEDTASHIDLSCAQTNSIVTYDTTGAYVSTRGIGELFKILTALPGSSDVGVIGSGSSGTVPIAADDFTTNTFLHINSNGGSPRGIATDAQNTLFITDSGNGTVASLPYPYTGTATILKTGFTTPLAAATWP